MIRIGVVNIDTSHPMAFANLLAKENRARYVAVYNDGFRGDDEVEAFIRDHGLEKRCASIEELADITDIGFIQDCDWDLHLTHAQPFFDRDKPVFLDKPIVGNRRDVDRLLELQKQGRVILGSSSMRYAQEIDAYLARPTEDRGVLVSAWGSCGVDEFNYGIHIVEALCALAQDDPIRCAFTGRASVGGSVCENYRIDFAGGANAQYSILHGTWLPCDVSAISTKGITSFRIDSGAIYKALLDRIFDYMETGESRLADVPTLTRPILAMLAGRISRGQGGGEIALSEVPLDDPGFDGAAFARGYAASAKKIYLK